MIQPAALSLLNLLPGRAIPSPTASGAVFALPGEGGEAAVLPFVAGDGSIGERHDDAVPGNALPIELAATPVAAQWTPVVPTPVMSPAVLPGLVATDPTPAAGIVPSEPAPPTLASTPAGPIDGIAGDVTPTEPAAPLPTPGDQTPATTVRLPTPPAPLVAPRPLDDASPSLPDPAPPARPSTRARTDDTLARDTDEGVPDPRPSLAPEPVVTVQPSTIAHAPVVEETPAKGARVTGSATDTAPASPKLLPARTRKGAPPRDVAEPDATMPATRIAAVAVPAPTAAPAPTTDTSPSVAATPSPAAAAVSPASTPSPARPSTAVGEKPSPAARIAASPSPPHSAGGTFDAPVLPAVPPVLPAVPPVSSVGADAATSAPRDPASAPLPTPPAEETPGRAAVLPFAATRLAPTTYVPTQAEVVAAPPMAEAPPPRVVTTLPGVAANLVTAPSPMPASRASTVRSSPTIVGRAPASPATPTLASAAPVALPSHWQRVAPAASFAPAASSPAVTAPITIPEGPIAAPVRAGTAKEAPAGEAPSGDRPVVTTAPPQPAILTQAAPAALVFGAARFAAQVADDRDEPALAPIPGVGPLAAPVAAERPAVAAPSHTPLDMTREHWPATMIERIEMIRDAANEVDTRIRLIPDALGAIDVAVQRDGDTLHVRFQAEQPQTRALLADAAPRLAEAAETRGLRLGQTSVGSDAGAGAAGQGGQQNQQQRPSLPAAPPRAPRSPVADASAGDDDTRLA